MKAFFPLAFVLADYQAPQVLLEGDTNKMTVTEKTVSPEVVALHHATHAELLLEGGPAVADEDAEDGIIKSFVETASKNTDPALDSQKLWPVEEGKTCPTPMKVSSFNSESKSEESSEDSEDQVAGVSDQYGNCRCPEGTICITTDLLMKFDDIKNEIGEQGGKIKETLKGILANMKATVGCPALTQDRVHWYTSVTYYTWRTEGVSCYRLREGDDIRTLAIYFENNNNAHSAPKQGSGLSSNGTSTSAIVSSLAVVFAFILLAHP